MHGYEEVPQAASSPSTRPSSTSSPPLTGSVLVAGVLVSPPGAVAAWVLAKIARPLLGERGARDTVLYSPSTRSRSSPSRSLGGALPRPRGRFVPRGDARQAAACRRARRLRDRNARLIGLALLPALALLLWRGRDPRSLARLVPLLLLPAAVGLYALYLDWAIGDPWAFTSAQADWDRETSRSARWRGSRTRSSPPAPGWSTCRTPPPAGLERLPAGRALERLPPGAPRRGGLADLGRLAAARRGLRRLLGRDARDRPLGARGRVSARQPPRFLADFRSSSPSPR